MEIGRIVELVENFAPLELQAEWDCSGWAIELEKNVQKVLLCLSVTKNIINQAIKENCDLIISHHPLFFVPFEFNQNIAIYCAHTNLDKAQGGTTDTLIDLLELSPLKSIEESLGEGFLRVVELEKELSVEQFAKTIKSKLKIDVLRVVNNLNKKEIKKIAFCAGSGADLLQEAKLYGADAFVTGDVKYHCALESDVIIIDVGHFESERPVLKTLQNLIEPLNIEVVIADEKSPFINY